MRHAHLLCAGAVLLGTLAASRAANCTARFAGLQECAVLNGAWASGTAAQISPENMIRLEIAVDDKYKSQSSVFGSVSKSEACQTLYYQFNCVRLTAKHLTSDAGDLYDFAAPCITAGNSTGARMLPCYAWCEEFLTVCLPAMPREWRYDMCTPWTAPRTSTACFGSDGTNGMLTLPPPPDKSAARALHAHGWVGMLAVVVMHYLLN